MMTRANTHAGRKAGRATLSVGVSVIAILCAVPAVAQDGVTPTKPVTAGSPGTTSGAASVQAGTAATAQDQAAATTGTSGASQDASVTPPDVDREEIVVTGTRQSLATAQNIKKNSDTVVDAITASDIGALPDRSVNEALQRVPGVAISRFAAPTDAQHFSVQGSGVVIRGLSYVRGEFNGRDTFAANGGREIGFNDVPSELVGSVEVFKNLTADLIEGGISGTVNINTRKPFDTDKNLLYVSGGMSYGDFEGRGTPSGVALFSKQFDVGGGRIGILGSVTYSQFRNRADSVFLSSYLPRYNDDRNGNGVQDAGEGRTINAGTPFASTLFDTYPVPNGTSRVYVPLGAGYREEHINRERLGFSGALQYENADKTFLFTAQYLRTDSYEEHLDRTIEPSVYYPDATTTFPVGGVTPTYDANGVFTSGVLGRNTGALQGNLPNGGGYGPLTQFVANGLNTGLTNRYFNSDSVTQDHAINVKWDVTDRLHLNLDGQYVKSNVKGRDDVLDTATQTQAAIDTRTSFPTVQFQTPGFNTASYFANPQSVYFADAFNNRNINDGQEWAFRGDAQYDLAEDSFLRKIRVGGRYASRDQTVRTNDYLNWGAVSQTWTGAGPQSFAQAPAGTYGLHVFDNFLRGEVAAPPSANYVNPDIISNHDAFISLIRGITKAGGGTYVPIEDRVRSDGKPLVDGYFLPNEVYRNTEKTYAAYARLDFGKDDFVRDGMSLSGNIGVRWVRTQDKAFGSINFPQSTTVFRPDNNVLPDGTVGPARYTDIASYCAFRAASPGLFNTVDPLCTIPLAQAQAALAFANGGSTPSVASQSYDRWLPSFNLRLDFSPKFLMRFAYSKAISRPNFGSLRNVTSISPSGGNASGVYNFDGATSNSNPFLVPVLANQFDLTAEWYFAKVGQLTVAGFYKSLSDIILDNFGYNRTFTNNGQTFTASVTGPNNGAGSSKIKGVEVSYQQTYDFLPGFLRGFGSQATYTFVDAGNLPNSLPANAANDGNRPPLDVGGLYDNLPLAGLSKHNFNVAAFYDLSVFSARIAYSWRSKFLLNNRDCCFPFLPIYALPTGQLDGSTFLTVNRNFKIGIEVQNILNNTTKTTFLLNGQGLEAPRTFFKSDRQFTLSTRLTF
ncbi:TonB-dependent receptor [Sphingomonas melonis]|uniref:TonB-dependent receptor n=1 Tax=Sphingomonas melonis TaxID=152682 RepID=A0A7Y9FRG3_9SPHN|nr:TonB-dependent receptor [Sphingomonas melonis]NYD91762.1 TonB-dependent receptor [Sphingomonas melonis]